MAKNLEIVANLTEMLENERCIDIVISKNTDPDEYMVEVYALFDILPTPLRVKNTTLSYALWDAVEKFRALSLKDTN